MELRENDSPEAKPDALVKGMSAQQVKTKSGYSHRDLLDRAGSSRSYLSCPEKPITRTRITGNRPQRKL